VGVKISPAMSQGGFRPTGATVGTYDHLVAALNRLPLSHLQILRAAGDVGGTPVEPLQDTVGYYRTRFEGTIIANLGYDKVSAASLIESGGADLVSFAKPFISNPDLVRRFERDLPLTPPVVETFYQGGSKGYVDYAPAA
jgi:N-ethylmaleimide reductase